MFQGDREAPPHRSGLNPVGPPEVRNRRQPVGASSRCGLRLGMRGASSRCINIIGRRSRAEQKRSARMDMYLTSAASNFARTTSVSSFPAWVGFTCRSISAWKSETNVNSSARFLVSLSAAKARSRSVRAMLRSLWAIRACHAKPTMPINRAAATAAPVNTGPLFRLTNFLNR